MIYLQLFLSFLKIGLFGFGGGLAIFSLIQHEVEKYGWMTQEEFVDILAISQVTPGPIGINCATYVGYTATGSVWGSVLAISQVTPGPIGINCATYVGYTATGSVWGSVLATTAIVIPSLVIMLAICKLYFVISTRFQHSIYFTRTMYTLRLSVLGMIAAAALLLIKPINQPSVSFIDWRSWTIFVIACIITIVPRFFKKADFNGNIVVSFMRKSLQIISNPILLIIIAGLVGYLIYA